MTRFFPHSNSKSGVMAFHRFVPLIFFVIVTSLPATGLTQSGRTELMFCGTTSRSGADLHDLTGLTETTGSCDPGNTTRALLVTREAKTKSKYAGKGDSWKTYLQNGGVIITEYNNPADVYNEIFGTSYTQGSTQLGDCLDNIMPAVKLNTEDVFWTNNDGLEETGSGNEGCGYDIATISSQEDEVTALGRWEEDANSVQFARRNEGDGVLWLVATDWQDSQAEYSDDSKDLMGILINGGEDVAAINLAPNPLDFGNQEVGTTSAAATVTVENSGSAELDATVAAATGPFQLDGGTCGGSTFTVAVGASCTLTYTFSPTSPGAVTQTLAVTSNASSSPDSLMLQGDAMAPESMPNFSPPRNTVESIPALSRMGALFLTLLILISFAWLGQKPKRFD